LRFAQLAATRFFVWNPTVFVDVVDALKTAIAKETHIEVYPTEDAFENRKIVFVAFTMSYSENAVIKHINNQHRFCRVPLFLAGILLVDDISESRLVDMSNLYEFTSD